MTTEKINNQEAKNNTSRQKENFEDAIAELDATLEMGSVEAMDVVEVIAVKRDANGYLTPCPENEAERFGIYAQYTGINKGERFFDWCRLLDMESRKEAEELTEMIKGHIRKELLS